MVRESGGAEKSEMRTNDIKAKEREEKRREERMGNTAGHQCDPSQLTVILLLRIYYHRCTDTAKAIKESDTIEGECGSRSTNSHLFVD